LSFCALVTKDASTICPRPAMTAFMASLSLLLTLPPRAWMNAMAFLISFWAPESSLTVSSSSFSVLRKFSFSAARSEEAVATSLSVSLIFVETSLIFEPSLSMTALDSVIVAFSSSIASFESLIA